MQALSLKSVCFCALLGALTACSSSDSPPDLLSSDNDQNPSNTTNLGDVGETESIEDDAIDNETSIAGSSDASANVVGVADAPAENASEEEGNGIEIEPAETQTNSSTVAGTSLVTNGYVMVRNERIRLDGSLRNVVQFDVDYENNTLLRSSSFPNGVNDLTVHELFSFDTAGNFIARKDFGEEADLVRRDEYLYNAQGYLTNENLYFLSDGRQFGAFDYSYRDDGKLAMKLDEDDTARITVNYVYSEAGQLLSSSSTYQAVGSSFSSTTIAQYILSSDTDQIVRMELFSEDGGSVSGYSEYRYDANGNLVQIDWFRADGEAWFTDLFYYEPSEKPIFNYWLFMQQFFPEKMRWPV